jgi:hypothetical protein
MSHAQIEGNAKNAKIAKGNLFAAHPIAEETVGMLLSGLG